MHRLLRDHLPALPDYPKEAKGPVSPPHLADGVRIHQPTVQGEPWVAQRGEEQYFRIGADLAKLASSLDGVSDASLLAGHLGQPWTQEAVQTALKSLDHAHLLARIGDEPERHRSRLKYVRPLTLQFAVLRSSADVAQKIRSHSFASARTLARLAALLGIAGALALVLQGAQIADLLSRPVPVSMLLVIVCAMFFTTVAHELGHACVLSHYGGHPGRLGFMLFYFSPAMFCDVSDSWRLTNRQRVHVALAGISVQVSVGGAAACAASAAAPGTLKDTLLFFALSNQVAALVNLLPFVKLDGYIALMSHLDFPNLRSTALSTLRERFVGLLAGSRPEDASERQPAWLPWFGLACAITPIALVFRVLGRWLDSLLSLGYVGMSISAALAGLVVNVSVKGTKHLRRSLRRNPPRLPRLIALLVAVAALVAAGASVRVSTSEGAAYSVGPDGQVQLLVPAGTAQNVRQGDRVELISAGLLLHHRVGGATVTAESGKPTPIALSGLIPVRFDAAKIPGIQYTLHVDKPLPQGIGSARLNTREVSLPDWIFQRFLKPFAVPFL
ncbi:daptide biosynthesis intramembrane metalloprotease [Streptomyces sp. NPDC056534]|uniref:daptide biosynthesis intramembrane metalloprotease n=1 Tax=Streptomyces sp. NPDC056534 TaxID=3345857 RepID=UPI0036C80BBE